MAKFSGKIGYAETSETSPGVWKETITERQYKGDLIRHYRKWDSPTSLNDDIVFIQDISIVADPYAYTNAHNMRYVVFNGVRWKISTVEIERPRIKISTGGEWHGITPGSSN